MEDLSPLTPEARPIAGRAAAVYLRHAAPWFVGLLVHGSALKGGFIPGCSDIDFKLYLDAAAFDDGGQLLLRLCLAIHRDLSRIDPAPFRYIQCVALAAAGAAPDLVGPVPGAYHLLAGRLPEPEATARGLREAARRALAALDPAPAFLTSGLLDHGGGRLAAQVRLLCTKVWPALHHLLILQGHDPFRVWGLPKDEVIALLPEDRPLGRPIRDFYRAVRAYYPGEASIEGALAVIETGVATLQAVNAWWEEAGSA